MLVDVRKATLDDLLQFSARGRDTPVAVTGSSIGLANIFMKKRKDLKEDLHLGDLGMSSLENHGGP